MTLVREKRQYISSLAVNNTSISEVFQALKTLKLYVINNATPLTTTHKFSPLQLLDKIQSINHISIALISLVIPGSGSNC